MKNFRNGSPVIYFAAFLLCGNQMKIIAGSNIVALCLALLLYGCTPGGDSLRNDRKQSIVVRIHLLRPRNYVHAVTLKPGMDIMCHGRFAHLEAFDEAGRKVGAISSLIASI